MDYNRVVQNKHPFSQLIREIFLKMKGLQARLYMKYTPSEHNESVSKNFLTQGGLVLADFFVTLPRRNHDYNLALKPRNQAQTPILQLRKEGN